MPHQHRRRPTRRWADGGVRDVERPAVRHVTVGGALFSAAQPSLAVVRGTGEMFWFSGNLPPADGDVVLGPGETYRVNGWTIRNDPYKAFIVNDFYKHGFTINETEMRQI